MTYFVYYPKVGESGLEHPPAPAAQRAWADVNPENYRDLVAYIACRPTLAACVILAANAAIHGSLAHKITSVDQAVVMLGVDRVSALAKQTLAL